MTAAKTPLLRPLVLSVALAVAGLGAGTWYGVATAQSAVQAPAPELVAGLPDFTRLVDQVGPAVVSVQAEIGNKSQAMAPQRGQQQMPDDEEIPEFFRRFFGPGMSPMPGMPGGPGGPNARPRGMSQGTGFIISADGYVLTNHHVVDGADTVRIRMTDRREFVAKVVGSDEQSDVALLKIDGSGLPSLRIGDSRTLKSGQWVVAIGSPFGLDHSVTAGIISAVGRANPYAGQRYVPFIQTDVAINRGNSGGPLLDTRGQVVGINSQIFSNSGGYMGVSFAIPIDVAMNAVQQLKATGKVTRGQLGVQIQAITRENAKALGLAEPNGALVARVEPGSPAERAGILRQDVIRSINGQPVYDSSDLPPIVGAMAPGTKVSIEVIRDGKPRTVTATLNQLTEATAGPAVGADGAPRPAAAAQANALGIVGEDLDPQQRSRLGLEAGEGVLVARVEGVAAREAGLRPGDVILAVGRNDVSSAATLNAQLRAFGTGKPVMLLVRRGGGTQYLTINPSGD
ncbi:DegQ family serine endoprotease [Thermomonas carbonis]|uniref:Probable periplasmic serine endoprotease DegP-like n=1 Tax=Thermomonas carbonis TaxID=1463158 RepID=A0A7G9SMV0_9GAMM|nr:DegQ family serine endoprotease [Thermomonas carbonis]QNN69175.1 DegQ family serine endoprotease [Thermomonas carbonis]GHC06274.1 peptidase S1 [Thermomonas carbonis]